MDPNQYPYTNYAEPPPLYQPYSTAQYSGHRLSQSSPSEYDNPGHRASYIQPQSGVTSPTPLVAELPAAFVAELPAAFVAELPAALPVAPRTTTPLQQLNEDELLAKRLQDLEVEEARRKSRSNISLHPSTYSLRDAASLNQRTQSQLETPPPRLPPRPHSESFASLPFYGPDSFGPPPTAFNTTDGRLLMAHADSGNIPPPTPQAQTLPEVVVGAHPVSTAVPNHAPIMNNMSFAAPAAPAPMDPVSLASYLEVHRGVPYPPQWRLPPVVDTLYATSRRAPKATDWLDFPQSREWRRVRSSKHVVTPTDPIYSFSFKSKGGSLRDARYSWTMLPGQWSYNLRLDNTTGMRKSEFLTPPKGNDLITTYIQAQNYDSLRFIGPDHRVYLWVAHMPLSSRSGARYDTLRHALFMAPRGYDPLYGEIVADHAYWDGFIDYSEVHRVTCGGCGASPINGLRWKCKTCADHDICEQCRLANKSAKSTCSFSLVNVPDEALYIRSAYVDPALVCATLQIVKDWEFHILRMQKNRDPQGFKVSEDLAREGDLGKLSYWRLGDEIGKGTKVSKDQGKEANSNKVAKAEKARAKERVKTEKVKEKAKEKEKDKKGTIVGIGELVRGSAQVGGAVGDVGEALRRDSGGS